MNEHIDIIEFARTLFFNPKAFFRNYFSDYTQPPFFVIAMAIFGIGYGIDRLDTTLKPDAFDDHWVPYWCIAIIGGVVGGYICYLIAGWFYNVRLKWSEGKSDIEKSRNLVLYSGVVSSVAVITSTLIDFMVKERPSDSVSVYYSIATILLLMLFHFYSIFVSFCGVTTITDANYNKARLWFLIIPAALSVILYLVALWPFFKYFMRE